MDGPVIDRRHAEGGASAASEPTLPLPVALFLTFSGTELDVDALDELQQDPPKCWPHRGRLPVHRELISARPVKARKRCLGEAAAATGISGAYWRGSRPGPMTVRAASRPALHSSSGQFKVDAGGGGDVPGMSQHVEEVDPGRQAGRERAEGQVARPRHVGRGPRRPRRPGGRPQRDAVVAADEIAGRRAGVIAAARGEVGELERDADRVVHHVAYRPSLAGRGQR